MKKFSAEQAARIEAGWDDKKAARIEADYPNLSADDFLNAQNNVEDSVFQDYDLSSGDSVMDIYAASCEGISNELDKEAVAQARVDRVQECRERIAQRAEELRQEVYALEAKGHRLMPSRRAQEELIALIKEGGIEPSDKAFQDLLDKCQIASKVAEVDRLEETLQSQLMQVDTRYVITDSALVSPSGINMSDRVFLQPTIAIHCDRIPLQLPRTDRPLIITDMRFLR
jgi:hypothetical protein